MYIVKAKYQIAPSKDVVGVDRSVYALSKNKHNPIKYMYKEENCSHSCHFVNNDFFETNSFMHMFNVSSMCR